MCSEDEDDDVDSDNEFVLPPVEKKKKGKVSRAINNQKSAGSQSQFLAAFTAIQQSSQESQIQHEKKMQEEALEFQAKLEQDRLRFESETSQRLQQSSQLFQQQMSQQNQIFQAQLFKMLFDQKKD